MSSCFWDGLIKKLDRDDLKVLGLTKKPNSIEFVRILKTRNVKTPDIYCQGDLPTTKQLEENYLAIKNCNIKELDGYDCSTFEPFLFLYSHLLRVNIVHRYLSYNIEYTNKNATKTYKFKSSAGHFWAR